MGNLEIGREYINKFGSGGNILIKEESKLMKVLSFILYPFNQKFLSQYITTINKNIYVPKAILDNKNPWRFLEIICHECIHINQYEKYSILFVIGYLFPQILFIISLPILLMLGTGWFSLFSLLFLLPLPAYFRFRFEIEAYKTSILFGRKIFKYDDKTMDLVKEHIVSQLGDKWYYFCWPFKNSIREELNKEEEILSNPKYEEILLYLKSKKLL